MDKKDKSYKYVDYLWDDGVAESLDPVERLRYRSNILGSDQRITNTGDTDLVFLCICTPRFDPQCYQNFDANPRTQQKTNKT